MKNGNVLFSLIFMFGALFATEKPEKKNFGKELFPLSSTTQYIYDSSFGDATINASLVNNVIETKSEADNFKYQQKYSMNENGIYLLETYQGIKLLLFIKKESRVTYNRSMLRYSFPMFVGKEWKDSAIEYINDDSNKVYLSAKVLAQEEVQTKAGKFETIKIESIVESETGSKNIVTEWLAEETGLVKAKIEIKGGGLMGFARDILGYGTINFELKEIKKK